MGSERTSTRRRRRSATVAVDGLWVDEHPVTNARVPAVRRRRPGTSPSPNGRPDPADFPGADPAAAGRRVRCVFPPTPGRCPLDDWTGWWRWVPGRRLAAPRRARSPPCTAGTCTPSSTSASRTPRPTPPGPAGGCPPRPSGSTPRAAGSTRRLRLGRRAGPRGRVHGQHAGRATSRWQNLRPHGFERTSPVGGSRPTATACSTSPATCGSGRRRHGPSPANWRPPSRRSTAAARRQLQRSTSTPAGS